MTFRDCLITCAGEPAFVEECDRLLGTSLTERKSPIVAMIDEATGKEAVDVASFVAFTWDIVWSRLPQHVRDA